MVNPAVYGFVKYDPERLSGFAFGMGVDRLAMMKYGVTRSAATVSERFAVPATVSLERALLICFFLGYSAGISRDS